MKQDHGAKRKRNFIFGIRAVAEAVGSGQEIEKVFIQQGAANEQVRAIKSRLKALGIPFQLVPREKLQRITRKNHQGVICFLSPISFASLDHVVETAFSQGREPLLIILDRITDVRNFGSIARTMECLGADALLIQSRGNAMLGGDAMKASAGALNILPVCRVENLKTTIVRLRESGIRVVGATEKTDKLIYETNLTGPLAVIMGSEENGISPEYLKLCDEKVKIPMTGKIASLNVSVATGIIMYEIIRQRALPA